MGEPNGVGTYMRASKVREYILAHTGVLFTRETIYRWMTIGVISQHGAREKMQTERRIGKCLYTRADWIDEFMEKVRTR
jgi:hypothetical protein